MSPTEAQQGSGQEGGREEGNAREGGSAEEVGKTTTVAQAVHMGAKGKRARPAETRDPAATGMCKCTAARLLANSFAGRQQEGNVSLS